VAPLRRNILSAEAGDAVYKTMPPSQTPDRLDSRVKLL
jgi:hypothetical protein